MSTTDFSLNHSVDASSKYIHLCGIIIVRRSVGTIRVVHVLATTGVFGVCTALDFDMWQDIGLHYRGRKKARARGASGFSSEMIHHDTESWIRLEKTHFRLLQAYMQCYSMVVFQCIYYIHYGKPIVA
jgi:hypothetical protein